MKILEVPKTVTLKFGENPDGSPVLTRAYPFAQYLKDAILNPGSQTTRGSGLGTWDKQEIGVALLDAVNAALKKGDKCTEIVLEDTHYDALLEAVKVNSWTPEAGTQTTQAGYRKAIENPKKGKAGE